MSVCCKSGGIERTERGILDGARIRPGGFEAMRDRIAQAHLLDQADTQMNAIVGLCVGHGMLLNKHSAAPVTTLVVKTRATGPNPVSALCGQNSYCRPLKKDPVDEAE